MFAEVERVWNGLDQGMIDRPALDFWRRCGLCQVCQGKTISQLLSSHIQVPRRQGIGQATAAVFTDEVDEHLRAVVYQAKSRTSWKNSERPEFADYLACILKQRGFPGLPGENRGMAVDPSSLPSR
jgi:hypothetical protein